MPFPKDSREGAFQLLASGDADDGALTINADARVLGATVKAGESIAIDAEPDRHLYLVPSGRVRVNGVEAGPRDGVAITGEAAVEIEAEDDASWCWSTPARRGRPESGAVHRRLCLNSGAIGGHVPAAPREIGAIHAQSGSG